MIGGAELYDDLVARGLVHQCTDEATARAALTAGTSAYIGFDPTADSLHVGSLQQIVLLRRLQLAGSRPIALVGGGTGLIGDPSGKSAERTLLDGEAVARNAAGIRDQLARFLDFDGPAAATLQNNVDWLGGLGLLEFLRDVGKHFSVNAMVQRDSVRTRLESREQGISYTEFSYMLLQAYDFLVLYRDHGCRAQLGGSDQWGNIVSGIDLIRRHLGGEAALAETDAPFGLTSPLVTTRSGTKFGKTEQGTIWLDAARTSPYALYQFWLGADDAEVDAFLRRFTMMPVAEIEALMARHAEQPAQRTAQRELAREVVTMAHGEEGLRAAERATSVLFTGKVQGMPAAELESIFADVPSSELPLAAFEAEGRALRLLLVGDDRPFASNGEAKRKLKEGAVRINGVAAPGDLAAPIGQDALIEGRLAVIKVGKKQTYLVRLTAGERA